MPGGEEAVEASWWREVPRHGEVGVWFVRFWFLEFLIYVGDFVTVVRVGG